jgi:CheY-like chemotaxis protein
MAKPIVMTVDDEPHVLNAIARDLQAHYQKDYRIVKASSGAEALATVQEFKRRNTPVALLLVDQRMPGMSGTEFLAEAIKLYPQSKKVLLTAYADTDAAIARTAFEWPALSGRRARTTSRTSSPAARYRTSGWISSEIQRRGSWSSRSPKATLVCRLCSSRTAVPWSIRTSAPWRTRWV